MLLLLLLFGALGCQEKKEEPKKPKNDNSLQLSDSLEVKVKRKVALLPEAQEQVSSWIAFVTAQNEINSMKKATGSDLVQKSQPLVQIMERLQSSVPDTLKEPAVLTRINVLVTKANVLHQFASQKNIPPKEIFDTSNDIILEFGNFKIQLNEMFMKTLEDFETELDLQFEEAQDSIL